MLRSICLLLRRLYIYRRVVNYSMEEEISLVELFDILKKHSKTIILTTIIATVLAALYTFFFVTPTYESSTEILVTQSTEETPAVSQTDINASIALINTYEDIIRNDVILNPVIEELGLNTTAGALRENIRVETDDASQVFSIRVESADPYRASEIANTTANYFQEEIYDMMNVDNVTIISGAAPNITPVSPNHLLNILIGFLLGAMLGVGIVFLRELLDNTVKTAETAEEVTGWPNLGQVTVFTEDDLMVRRPKPSEEIERTLPSEEMPEQRSRTRRRV